MCVVFQFSIKVFHLDIFSAERSSTGLLEFESKSEAIEALVLTNHHPIPSQGKKKKINKFLVLKGEGGW